MVSMLAQSQPKQTGVEGSRIQSGFWDAVGARPCSTASLSKSRWAPPPCLLSSVRSTAAGAPVDSSARPPGLGTIVTASS